MFYRFALYGFLKNLRFFDPFILLIFMETGLSFFQIGLLYTIRDVTTNIFEIPSGVYADAFGRKKSMIVSFVAYIFSFIIFYFSTHFSTHAIAMIFFALGEAFRSGTHKALILAYLNLNQMQHLKVEYYGKTRAASQLGSAVNAIIATGLVLYSGSYRYIFVASIIPYVFNLINLATYPNELDEQRMFMKKGEILSQIKTTLKTFFVIFKDRYAVQAILNSAGFTAFFKSSKDYLQPILQVFAMSLPFFIGLHEIKRSAVVIGVVYFFIYLLSSYASRSAERFRRWFGDIVKAINVTFLIGACCLIIAGVSFWQNITIVSVCVFLCLYLLYNLRKPMNVAFISNQISDKVMASGLSAESQFTTILMAIFSPILGMLADNFDVGTALFIFGGGMLLFSLLAKVENRQLPT